MIRRATIEDAPALAAILRDWTIGTGWMPILHTPEDDLGFLTHLIGTTDVFVTGDTGPLGFLSRDGEDIPALYLSPAMRGLGQGKALLDMAKADQNRLSLWAFQANPRAIAFYRREGFAEIERTDGQRNNEKLPDLRMVWERTTP